MQNVPRPEHPRPDRFRAAWMNLNGRWQFAFDPRDEGMQAGWMDERPLPDRIVVPFAPESRLSGVHDEGIHPLCWYKRTINLPAAMMGQRTLLHFGAVDHETDVWLNGHLLGRHTGGYAPFCFDVTPFLQAADNRLAVRVHDDPRSAQCRGKQDADRYPKGSRYMRVSGIWQTVWLENVGQSFLHNWRIVADPDSGQVDVSLSVNGNQSGLQAEAVVYFGTVQNAEHSYSAPVENASANLSFTVPHVRPWTPETPNLFWMNLTLRDAGGAILDQAETYFGFRRIEVKDGQFLLNGQPFFFKAALDQGYHPDGLYTPPTDARQRDDVAWAKRFGLNGIRKHQIVPEPRFFYWCDRLGLTVWSEMANWGARLSSLTDNLLAEWKDCMLRDINHPSIIAWVPTNEWIDEDTNKPADLTNPDVMRAKLRAYEATKALDPTRLALDTSGYCHTQTDICDLHQYCGTGPEVENLFHRRHVGPQDIGHIDGLKKSGNMTLTPLTPLRKAYCPGYRYRGEPVVISEVGSWGIMECPPNGRWAPYWYGPVKTTDDFLALYREVFTALMREPDCAGFCFVQLYDVEGEANGYLTYDRKPKIDPATIAAIHAQR